MISEQSRDNERPESTNRFRKRLWLIVVFVVVLCVVFWRVFFYESVDEKLAAIGAARAIPDSENAAVYYTRFFTDPNNASVLEDLFSYTPSAYRAPWHSSEHPELAGKLKTHRQFIQTLLDISEMRDARFPVYFPVYPDPGNDSAEVMMDLRRVTFVLSWAAANDLAEGRAEEAHNKYVCQLRLASHLEQQPASAYRAVGIAIEALAFKNIRAATMREDMTEDQLRSLETALDITQDDRIVDAEIADEVDRLIDMKQRSQLPLLARFKAWLWLALRFRRQNQTQWRLIDLRRLSSRRATRILIALRRHKDKTGCWPESLDEIGALVAEDTLIDPQNNEAFVYKRGGDGFVFYSKGLNGIDEGGLSSGSADDWPIWSRRISQVEAESTDPGQPNANQESTE